MQITLLESLITEEKHNFCKLCSYTFNSSSIQVVERICDNLYEYIKKVYLKKGFTPLLDAKKLSGYVEYMREKKNDKQPASVSTLTNKTLKVSKQEVKKSRVDDEEYEAEILFGTQAVDS
jgi:GTP-binding protein EngB required for normal cell division